MHSSRSETVPLWLRAVVWSIAISLTLVGIITAIVSSSVWPLVAIAGLAIPMLPIGTLKTTD